MSKSWKDALGNTITVGDYVKRVLPTEFDDENHDYGKVGNYYKILRPDFSPYSFSGIPVVDSRIGSKPEKFIKINTNEWIEFQGDSCPVQKDMFVKIQRENESRSFTEGTCPVPASEIVCWLSVTSFKIVENFKESITKESNILIEDSLYKMNFKIEKLNGKIQDVKMTDWEEV